MANTHDFQVRRITGETISLAEYAGKVLLLVNVASRCGLTPQYTALEALHREQEANGFAVLGFPCNQFGAQEPGTEAEIQQFCQTKYDITFPMFSKVDVNGATQHPLYAFLTGPDAAFPGAITWNFEKFLISKDGQVLQRFAPRTAPDAEEVRSAIKAAF
jgi:glutathione peroxidase